MLFLNTFKRKKKRFHCEKKILIILIASYVVMRLPLQHNRTLFLGFCFAFCFASPFIETSFILFVLEGYCEMDVKRLTKDNLAVQDPQVTFVDQPSLTFNI